MSDVRDVLASFPEGLHVVPLLQVHKQYRHYYMLSRAINSWKYPKYAAKKLHTVQSNNKLS